MEKSCTCFFASDSGFSQKSCFEEISKIALFAPDYDHSETPIFLQMDTIVPPLLPASANDLAMYEVRCGFGTICFCMSGKVINFNFLLCKL